MRRLIALGWPVLALATVLALPYSTAAAQFTQQPDGTVRYDTDLTTTGAFQCFPVFLTGSCVADANTLVLTNGGASLRLTFTGRSGPIIATNVSTGFDYGTLTSVFDGIAPFVFPTVGSVSPIFSLAVTFGSTQPSGSATRIYEFFNREGSSQLTAQCCAGSGFLALPTSGGGASPFAYGAVVYNNLSPITVAGRSEQITLQAQVGIVPEPASLALMATGLLGVFGIARRRVG